MMYLRWFLIVSIFLTLCLMRETLLGELSFMKPKQPKQLETKAMQAIAAGEYREGIHYAAQIQQVGEAHRARGTYLAGLAGYTGGNKQGGLELIEIAAKQGDALACEWMASYAQGKE